MTHKEIHGVADALKISAVKSIDRQSVTVEDGYDSVLLILGTSPYPAGLDPTQARAIARELQLAATRLDTRQSLKKK